MSGYTHKCTLCGEPAPAPMFDGEPICDACAEMLTQAVHDEMVRRMELESPHLLN